MLFFVFRLKPHFQHIGCEVVYQRQNKNKTNTENEDLVINEESKVNGMSSYYTAILKGPPHPIKSRVRSKSTNKKRRK